MKPLTIYLIAGEASGDLLGAHLMRSLKAQHGGDIRFHGVGGDKMAAEGLASLFPYQELSMLGVVEILPTIFNTFARIRLTVEDVEFKQPDMVITIDSPGFCFRVVERLREKKLAAKFVHYVAPTVWVYKPQRAEKCAKLFDHMLVLLPFEPPYFERVGLPCTWVGHPVVAETPIGDGARFREKYQIANDVPLFCLLPGSRKSEVERHMPIFGQALLLLAAQFPNLAMAVAVPANVMPFVAPFFEGCPFRAVITADEQDKKDAFAAANFAIVKSGTVTLEVAMAGVPMVVAYRVHPLTAWWLRRLNISTFANLINILTQQEVIPELLQELCTPEMIAETTLQLLTHPEQMLAQKEAAKAALAQLYVPGSELPSDKAARTVLQLLSLS